METVNYLQFILMYAIEIVINICMKISKWNFFGKVEKVMVVCVITAMHEKFLLF